MINDSDLAEMIPSALTGVTVGIGSQILLFGDMASVLIQCNRPGKSSSVAGSIVLRDCATMKLSPQCRSGTAGHHHPSQTLSKHFLVLSTIETLEIPFKRCWIT